MARVTVTDCLEHVDNRFQLVLIASKRARQLSMGAKAMVEADNDKPTVIALREIAEQHVDASILDADNTGFFNEDEEIEEVSDDLTDEQIIAMIEGDLATTEEQPTVAEDAPVESVMLTGDDDVKADDESELMGG